MQTSQLKQCTDCDSLLSLYNKVICSIYQLIKEKWTSVSYNTGESFNSHLYGKLLRIKRILYKRLYNQSYPDCKYSNQDIISITSKLLYKANNCLKCPCEDFTNFISICKCYNVANLSGPSGVTVSFTYKDCNGALAESGVGPGSSINVCAEEGSVVSDYLVITLIGDCNSECTSTTTTTTVLP